MRGTGFFFFIVHFEKTMSMKKNVKRLRIKSTYNVCQRAVAPCILPSAQWMWGSPLLSPFGDCFVSLRQPHIWNRLLPTMAAVHPGSRCWCLFGATAAPWMFSLTHWKVCRYKSCLDVLSAALRLCCFWPDVQLWIRRSRIIWADHSLWTTSLPRWLNLFAHLCT